MGGRLRGAIALASLLAIAACAGASSPGIGEAVAAGPATLADGVYTAAQAERGRAAYASRCSSCHAEDLRGNSNAPSLVGSSFLFLWEDRTLEELYVTIRTEMPTNAPGSLPAETYLDVLTYVLEANDFPAGGRELLPDADWLRRIVIKR
jgi:mono/diheme cytochrome c family protein